MLWFCVSSSRHNTGVLVGLDQQDAICRADGAGASAILAQGKGGFDLWDGDDVVAVAKILGFATAKEDWRTACVLR